IIFGQLLISILLRKLPVYFLFILISSLHPRSHFISKCSYVAYSPFGAFCIHHINLYFGSIKPTRMLWRVMEFYLFQDLFCFLFAECLIAVSYTHLRAHETRHDLVCRLLLEKKKK